MQETGVTVFRPYPGEDYQTICRCHSQVAAHSPEMFLDWVLFWSRALALDLRRSTTWTNQAVVFERLLTFAYAFYPHNRHWHTRYKLHLGPVTCHKPHNPLLTKSEKRMLMAYIWKTHLSQKLWLKWVPIEQQLLHHRDIPRSLLWHSGNKV